MKKYFIIAIPVILLLIGIIIYSNGIYVPNCKNAEIVCVDKTNSIISPTVSKEDTETLKVIFDKNHNLHCGEPFEIPSCGFSENYCIKFDNETFYPACDSCGIVKYKMKYFNISDSEKETITDIMKKYGAYYPYG